MNQIIITNQNQSFRITISDIKKIDTYCQFQLSIKSSVFLVSTIARAWTEEWFNWKEGLKEMAEKKVKSIHFSPLGEYWNILFELKEENIISIKGSISDLEREQSNLEFGGSRHYKIFCVNGNTGFRNESRIFYFIHLQNEEDYERKESSSA